MASSPKTQLQAAAAPHQVGRRSLLMLGVPAIGAGVAGGLLLRSGPAGARDSAATPPADPTDGLTPHREAYYRRARF